MALVMVPYDKLLGGETDSGKYTSADAQTKGVIRFLQGYTGVDVSGYGFYFVDGDGEIVKYEGADYKLESTAPMTGGFYGDLDAIPENYTNTYYAKPFVNIEMCIRDSNNVYAPARKARHNSFIYVVRH